MRVLREEVFSFGIDIGEIASAAAGDADFLTRIGAVISKPDRTATLGSFGSSHHASRTSTDNGNICMKRF